MKNKGGRPTKFNGMAVQKLEEAFAWGCTDKEACLYAGIAPSTLYNYQKTNKRFLERKETLRQWPTLVARRAVVEALKKDSKLSLRYLERKLPEEFNTKLTQEVIVEDKTVLERQTPQADLDTIKEFHAKLRANRLRRSREKAIADGELIS